MPVYEYQCEGCNEVFEVFQKVSDPAPAQHSCGSGKIHRILSHTSFVLKGTGWYATDFADKPKKNDEPGGKDGKANKKTAASSTEATGRTEGKTQSSSGTSTSGGSATPSQPGVRDGAKGSGPATS